MRAPTDISFSATSTGELRAPRVRIHSGARVFIFYSFAILLTGIGSLLFADLLWRFGWTASRVVLLILFSILLLLISIGCVDAVYGFAVRRTNVKQTQFGDYRAGDINGASVALLFPIFNEDARRVCEGLRATYESLAHGANIASFDFFILSDSNDPNKWVEEERSWFDLVRDLNALGRIFYRRRQVNEGKKSGNIRDFLNAWGRRYRYFIVFDADSVMAGATIVDLVKMMETNPTIGLIQTAPALVNARTPFARMQQFANRLYGPIFFAGLDYWAQDGGNYWGHNAIIRTEPFMEFCDLPKLPGKKPLGGQILSHDFVEAALLRKENWEVWFAWNLDGSYEESPLGIIANAQRDRRWCQGNLQHSMLLFARGLRGISRIHLALGIFSYLAAPIWLLFLLTGTYLLWYRKQAGLSDIVVAAFTPFIRFGAVGHALLIFCFAMGMILLPRLLSLIDLALDPARRRTFGGLWRAIAGTFLETLFSTLHAPVQMLFHTKFVIATLCGFGTGWDSRQRNSVETSWAAACQLYWEHTAIGLGWGALVWRLAPNTFCWLLPLISGMILSIPLSVLTSRKNLGRALRRLKLFQTPEEAATPVELGILNERLDAVGFNNEAATQTANQGLRDAVLDPYVNAIHVSLLMEKRIRPQCDGTFLSEPRPDTQLTRTLGEKLFAQGSASLDAAEQIAILSDPDVMSWLHHEVWMRPSNQLAEEWRTANRR